MLKIDIPGSGVFAFEHLALVFNATLDCDGALLAAKKVLEHANL